MRHHPNLVVSLHAMFNYALKHCVQQIPLSASARMPAMTFIIRSPKLLGAAMVRHTHTHTTELTLGQDRSQTPEHLTPCTRKYVASLFASFAALQPESSRHKMFPHLIRLDCAAGSRDQDLSGTQQYSQTLPCSSRCALADQESLQRVCVVSHWVSQASALSIAIGPPSFLG